MRRSLCFSGRVSLTLFGIFLTILCAAAGAADFRVKPYVQNPATDAMTVIWFSDANTPGVLEYQSTPLDAQTTTSVPVLASALAYLAGEIPLLPGGIDPGPPYKHQIRLKGLSPDTRYDYRVNQGASETTGTFKTSPAGLAPVRFIVYADSETEPESTGVRVAWPDPTGAVPGRLYYIDQTDGYHANLDVIESREPDFIVISGDLAQSGGEQRDWDEFWLHNRGNRLLAGNVPILAAPGNHEYYGGTGGSYNQPSSENAMAKFRTYFDAPANNSPNPLQEKRYSRVDYGPVTIIILDVVNGLPHGTATDSNWYILGETEGGQAPDFNPGSRQYQWLEAQLADAQVNSLFTFVCFHNVPYSTGPHGYPPSSSHTQSGVPVQVLTPLFMQYGVDAILAGHDELYERSVINGTETLPGGGTRDYSLPVYDLGMGGDGLRGPETGLVNPYQVFTVHFDAPEIYNGENILTEGGKHYGHLEVNVSQTTDTLQWKAVLSPVHVFPLTEWDGPTLKVTGFERRVYDDEVEILYQSLATPTPTPSGLPDWNKFRN